MSDPNAEPLDSANTSPESSAGFSMPPITAGQLGMWIFISTEVMLFAAIIASYLIFRLSSLQSDWPGSSIMHVSITVGIINTLILVLSGGTVWGCHKAAKENRPRAAKLWLIATIILGTAFLGIKSTEYYAKYKVGLMPLPGEKQLHDAADIQYLANVSQRLKSSIADLESKVGTKEELPEDQRNDLQTRLDLYYSLNQYMAEFTSEKAGRNKTSYYAGLSIKLMASQIYPHPDTERNVEVVLEPELQSLSQSLQAYRERLALVRRRLEMVQIQVREMDADLEPLRIVEPTGADGVRFKAAEAWLATKKEHDQALQIEARRIETTLTPMQGRMDNLVSSFGPDGGLNEQHDIRLPVVVPNGQAWISCYLLLTGVHAIHLIGGLFVLIWWLTRRLDTKRAPALYITCMYWQFVDAIWLAIFWLIYF